MIIRENFTCPLEVAHDIVKGKWKTIILYTLKDKKLSLSELQNKIQGITQKMLLEQLRELREYGLVEKENFEGYPLKVEYFLTEKRGKMTLEAIKILQAVGVDYMVEHGMIDILNKKGIKYQ